MAIAQRGQAERQGAEQAAGGPERDDAPPLLGRGLSRELASAVGNRAMAQLVARNGTGPTHAPANPPHKKPKVTGNLPANQYELAWKWKWGSRLSGSLKFSASFQQNKLAEAKTGGGGGALTFWETKRVREKVAGEWATKVSETLLKGEVSGEVLPGVKVKANTKLLEAQVDLAKSEAEISLITLSFGVEGNITEWFLDAMGVPADQRSKTKITVAGEVKITPQLADIARIRDMWKARREMTRSAKAISETAERAKVVHRELSVAEKEVRALEKEAKSFAGYGKRQQARYGSRKAYETAEKKAQQKLTTAIEKKAALETEKATLKATLKAETKLLEKSRGLLARAASGLKSKAGSLIGKALATTAGKAVSKFLAHAIPIINLIAIAWDIVDIGQGIWKLLHGAKLGFGGGDEGSAEGTQEGEGAGGAGTGAGGTGGGDAGTSDAGAPDADAPSAGTPDAGAPPAAGGGTSAPNTGPVPDAGAPATDAGTPAGGIGAGTSVPVPDAPALDLPEPLHAGAQEVADTLKNGSIPLDTDQLWQLNSVVPKDFTPDQLKELKRRLQTLSGAGKTDPYELIGAIQAEVEKIQRGHDAESQITWVDGKFSEEQSSGAPADVLKQEAAAEEAKTGAGQTPAAPATTSASSGTAGAQAAKDAADAATGKTGAAGGKAAGKPKAKPKRKGKPPPKSLLPPLPSGFLAYDAAKRRFDWAPGAYDELTGTFYTLSDGLEVAITQAEIDQETVGNVIALSLTFEVLVNALPPKAGPDYPYKDGETKSYTQRYWFDPATGRSGDLKVDTGPGEAFTASVLALDGDAVVLKAKGKTVRFGESKLRIDGLSDPAKEESAERTDYYATLTVTVVSAPKHITGVVDAAGNTVRFETGKTVSFRVALSRAKPRPK